MCQCAAVGDSVEQPRPRTSSLMGSPTDGRPAEGICRPTGLESLGRSVVPPPPLSLKSSDLFGPVSIRTPLEAVLRGLVDMVG